MSVAVIAGAPMSRDVLLDRRGWETPELLQRARRAIDQLVLGRVGGDCWAPTIAATALPMRKAALIVLSDEAGSAVKVRRILDIAVSECREQDIVIYTARRHRDVISTAKARFWRIIAAPVDPWSLLDGASCVYTAGEEVGFLALLCGKPVRCFGNAFYAGWGLTQDDSTVALRHGRRSLEEVFAACCLLATDYVDPFSGQPSSFEEICTLLAEWRRIDDVNRRLGACAGMSFWKRRRMGEFLRSTEGEPAFCAPRRALRLAGERRKTVAVWGGREEPGFAAAARKAGRKLARIEDGFVRSVGLGADFMPAASIVVDERGIYYDPAVPSDLETILAETAFDEALLERARRLVQVLVARGITKYNTGAALPDLALPPGRRRLFVPGQVEDDRSVRLAGAGFTGNLQFLEQVRARNPDAIILYKPHPDVDAGHRAGAVSDSALHRVADRVLRGVSSAAIISAVDEVHTLTSLAGFEALLRERQVVVYGQPFYAGWGLTRDLAPIARRQRRLRLEELVAGALILYPRYLDPVTRLPCGPEVVIERLAHPELWRPNALVKLRRLQGAALALWRGTRARSPMAEAR